MKKLVSLFILAALAFTVGCATGNTTTSGTDTQITLDQALQKSAETRQKLDEAKAAYQNAKAAAAASKANGTSFETELAKQAVQSKINDTKAQVNQEVQAWKETLSK